MKMTASEILANQLAANDVEHIFAISGAGNVFLLDAIARHPSLRYVCPHHEQAGVMAAIAYSRLSAGKLGVMLTTGGPGAVNAITGVLNAWADSIPVLVISGQEKLASIRAGRNLRMWGVQGFNIVDTVKGMTKYAAMVTDPAEISYHFERAVHEARTGRPGPVWLDLPMDIQSAEVDPAALSHFSPPPETESVDPTMVKEVASLIRGALRPVLLLGNGLRLAGGAHLAGPLIESLAIPVITAWSGMDMVPSSDPLYFGHAGVYGGRCANFVVQNADLLLCIGTRLAIPQIGYNFAEYARGARKVVVDIDGAELRKFSQPLDLAIEADAREFVEALLAEKPRSRCPEWIAQCEDWRARYPVIEPRYHRHEPNRLNTYLFIDELNRHSRPDDVFVADAGAAHTTTQQVIEIKAGQKIIATTGLGEMGYGIPAAVGAAFARPGSRIILITGDGSAMMNLQELQTIVHHQLPVKIFLYENDGYLTIRNTQKALFGDREAGSSTATGVSCPDFYQVARAFGFPAVRISSADGLGEQIRDVLESPYPAVCVVETLRDQAFVPKLSLSRAADGQLVSPPLEDLSPLLPRPVLEREMLVEVLPQSRALAAEPAEPEVTAQPVLALSEQLQPAGPREAEHTRNSPVPAR